MPNWCENKVKITHKDPAMIEKLKKAFLSKKVGETFFPEPNWEDLLIKEKTKKVREKLKKEGQSAKSSIMENFDIDVTVTDKELEKDGRWYDWRRENWRTKWDFGGTKDQIHSEGEWLCLDFETAWSPPTGVYQALKSQGFVLRALYSEPGMGFAGIWDDGEDHYYQGNFKNFPKEVIDIFNLESLYED